MTSQNYNVKNFFKNQLLAALPPDELKRITSKMQEVDLAFNTGIYKLGENIEHVYFPISGIISLLAAVDKGHTTEVGIVGREGMVGLPIFLGVKKSHVQAVVQGNGTAMRILASDFETVCSRSDALNSVLRRFANSMMVQISQSAICFRFHDIDQRLARWLLMTSDRMEMMEFRVTQEFLSNMLGVRREAVNRAAKSLQNASLVVNRRGSISIVDRAKLEEAACVCYSVIRNDESIDLAANAAQT